MRAVSFLYPRLICFDRLGSPLNNQAIRTIAENASTLKFRDHGFEER